MVNNDYTLGPVATALTERLSGLVVQAARTNELLSELLEQNKELVAQNAKLINIVRSMGALLTGILTVQGMQASGSSEDDIEDMTRTSLESAGCLLDSE